MPHEPETDPDWIIQLPDAVVQEIRQRAIELMHEVVEILGCQTDAQKQDAWDGVITAAEHYVWTAHHQEHAIKHAPTYSQVRKRLEQLRTAAVCLAKILKMRDPPNINALSRAHLLRGGPVYRGEMTPELGGPTEQDELTLRELLISSRAAWLAGMIDAVADRADKALGELPDKSDQREGNIVWRDWCKRELVIECLINFDRFRPCGASTTTGSNFRSFVSFVFEIATGEKDVDHEKPVRNVIRDWKKAKERGLTGPDIFWSL